MVSIKSKPYRLLNRFLVIAGVLIVLLLLLQAWLIRNAGTILKEYITEQSGGKIKLELSSVDLNLFTKRMQIHNADLQSTDSINEPITYHVTFSKLSVRVNSVWKLLIRRKLLLDSLKIYDPDITVMQWRKDSEGVLIKNELTIPQAMGKIHTGLLDALDEFEVKRILIDNAKISLINKMEPGTKPVTVSSIFLNLVRTPVKRGNRYIFPKDKQILELRTSNQNIALPDGRHRIAFKSFRLQLFRQSIEFDSCTVTALTTDGLSNYKIFFKKLLFTGVDFAALSADNLVKADSVYCESPFFRFNLYRSYAAVVKTKDLDPDSIIRELAGNLNLAFVGVKNAGIHIDLYGKNKRSFFNSGKDDFEIHGFRIDPNALQPVSIKRFDMTMRNYRFFNEDSTSTFGFDRLHFLNSKVILNNFSILTKPGKNYLQNSIDVNVPYFELTELDWYKLIFEQRMAANKAVLKQAAINYTRKGGVSGKKISLFDVLLNLDSLVELKTVSMIDGKMNMRLGVNTSINVQNINFKVNSSKLLGSTTKDGLRNAVEYLKFSKGVLRLKDLTAQFKGVSFTSSNQLFANKILIDGYYDKLRATINLVYLDNLRLNDYGDNIELDGLKWENAKIVLKPLPTLNHGQSNGSNIHIRNIDGNHTQFNFEGITSDISTYVKSLNALSLIKTENGPFKVNGFGMTGKDLSLKNKSVNLLASSYILTDDNFSLKNVFFKQISGPDSITVSSPDIYLATQLNDLFASDLHFSKILVTNPVMSINKWNQEINSSDSKSQLPVRIDSFIALSPEIQILTHKNDSVSTFKISNDPKGILKASELVISGEGLRIDTLLLNTAAASFIKYNGEISAIEKGKIDLTISAIQFGKKDGKVNWTGLIDRLSLNNPDGLQWTKKNGKISFNDASLGNLSLSSELLPNFSQLMKSNVMAWLQIPQGQFTDSLTSMKWYNAQYDNQTSTLSIDSLLYRPALPLDSVLAKAPFELDYITLKTGSVYITGLDLERFKRDTAFTADNIRINEPVLNVFRDKKPPSSPLKRVRPLPVKMLENLPFPVSIQRVQLNDGIIIYSEKNGISRKQGNLFVTRVNATLENVKNKDFSNNDSLSLIFRARLMDSADVFLRLKESYLDSLGSFSWSGKVKGADLSILNPVLVPMSNIKITSGILDSVSIVARGREDLALGTMNMHYSKLRIKLIKDGNPDISTFKQNVLSFIANTFIIKNNNNSRKGIMYYKRSEGQSFVNYIIKTTLSGVLSTIGIKKNRKYIKQYEHELKESDLQEIKQ